MKIILALKDDVLLHNTLLTLIMKEIHNYQKLQEDKYLDIA